MSTSKVAGATAVQALTKAAAESAKRSRDWTGYCLMFVRTCLGIPAYFGEAEDAWAGAKIRHLTSRTTAPPAGAAIFYAGGKHGHVTLSAGGGMCWGTDLIRPGQVDKHPISGPVTKWGYRMLGWTEDLNGYALRLPKPTPPAGHWVKYRIKAGDSLVAIGNRIKASEVTIYRRNAKVLDAAARANSTRPNSDGGNYIYPGTVIELPQGFPGQRG